MRRFWPRRPESERNARGHHPGAPHSSFALRLAICACLLGLPAAARGQLPFIPEAGQGPELRLASADILSDEIGALTQKVERIRDERGPEIQAQRSRITTDLEETPQDTEPASPYELQQAHALLDALKRERDLYDATHALLVRAQENVESEPEAPSRPVTLDEQLDLELEARRLADAFGREQAVSQRLEALAESEPEIEQPPRNSAGLVSEAEARVVRARAMHAAARALEAQARARFASREAEVFIQYLEVRGGEVEAAKEEATRVDQEVEKELADIERQRTNLPPINREAPSDLSQKEQERLRAFRRELRLARLALLDRRVLAARSRQARAQTKVWALDRLVDDAPELRTLEAEQDKLAAEVARLDSRWSAAEAELARVRKEERTLQAGGPLAAELSARRQVLAEAFEVLVDVRENLETAKVLTDIVLAKTRLAGQDVSRAWGMLMSLLVLVLAFLAVRHGLRFGAKVLSPDDEAARRVALSDQRADQVYTALTLLWPLTVAVIAAAILVWPVWGLEITLLEAIKAIDLPLFYVDTTPVSVFSLLRLMFALWLAVVVSRAVRGVLSSRIYPQLRFDIGLTNSLNTLVHYVVVVIGLIIGLQFVGVGFSSLAIFAGVLGIGIAFGLRNVTENFISGLIILAERPIKIGDFIEVEGEVEGRVTRIQARSTTVVTRNNISVIIPNSEFVSKAVTNWSHGDPKVRIPVGVGVAYGSDTDLVRKALLDVAARHGHVLKRPPPEVQFRGFGDSSLDFVLLVWIDDQLHRFRIASDLHFAIDKTFRKLEIEIAFPQIDVHFKTVSEALAQRLLRSPPEPKNGSSSLPEALPSSSRSGDDPA